MAYPNPYNGGKNVQYQDSSYNGDFDPYGEVHHTYEPNNHIYEPKVNNRLYDSNIDESEVNNNNYPNYPPAPVIAPVRKVGTVRKVGSGFDTGEFLPDNNSRSVRGRYGQDNLCTKGGRGRCIGRICCCSLMTTLFLIVSIVLALALFIRPPSITIGSVQPLTGSGVSATNDGIQVRLAVQISVKNPNYFGVDFKKIEVALFYPINNTPVGGGAANEIDFKSHSETNFTFPFTLMYNSSQAQADAIFSDLASKCGVTGGNRSNLNINYQITLSIRILMATISPVISNTFNFPCPISASDISKLLGGLNLGSLG